MGMVLYLLAPIMLNQHSCSTVMVVCALHRAYCLLLLQCLTAL